MSVRESQIVYGRRGTGKTHVLKFVSSTRARNDTLNIYIDLRLIGSNQSVYGDLSLPVTERATRLVLDLLGAVSDELQTIAAARINEGGPAKEIVERLSDLGQSLSDVRVIGEVSESTTTSGAVEHTKASSLGLQVTPAKAGLSAATSDKEVVRNTNGSERSSKGTERYHLSFGRTQVALKGLIEVVGLAQVGLYIDEWSEVPLELQPLLADAIRKIILTNPKISVKIAAIEHRTNLISPREGNQYVGFELGADIPTGLNLDDFLVFDNDQDRAVDFFKTLLFKHVSIVDPNVVIADPSAL